MYKQDKTKQDYEYERQREECTFAPKMHKPIPREQNKGLAEVGNKNIEKDIERMKKARDERERVKKYTERGIILENREYPLMTTTLAETSPDQEPQPSPSQLPTPNVSIQPQIVNTLTISPSKNSKNSKG